MADVKTYNPAKFLCIIGGIPMSGFADGTFVNVESVTDGITSQSGADGEIARAISADVRHRVTLTLQQTSASNDVLSNFHKADRLSGGGVLLPILLEDLTGRTVFAVAQSWIVKSPARGFGKDVGTREWLFETGEPSISHTGGNS